jgi:glycosyltransferase involved in cell wall biosynthesis
MLDPTPSFRILHLVTGLGVGGAEHALVRLVDGLRQQEVASHVICLNAGGPVVDAFSRLHIPLSVLDVKGAPHRAPQRAARLVERFPPDIIQGWMYHANLAASLLRVWTRVQVPVVWNIRHSVADIRAEKPLTRWVIRTGGARIWKPQRVIYNSGLARKEHRLLGYARHTDAVIANGVDTRRFKPNADARSAWRRSHQFQERDLVVGLVARHHPMKDPDNFLTAAKRVIGRFARARFVMVGTGMTRSNSALVRSIEDRQLNHSVQLLGPSEALEEVYPGFDVLVVSSAYGEGLPNVILEAMACGVPTVSTAVGDASQAVLDRRFLAEPRDPDSLARGIESILDQTQAERREIGRSCRAQVMERYDEARCTGEFLSVYGELLGTRER